VQTKDYSKHMITEKDETMDIKVYCESYTDYSWECPCGKQNIEPEGQLDLDDGENVFCSHCRKEFVFNRKALKLKEHKE